MVSVAKLNSLQIMLKILIIFWKYLGFEQFTCILS